jgi:hypothetical protein
MYVGHFLRLKSYIEGQGVSQVAEHPLSKHKALSSNPTTEKNKITLK